MLHRLVQTHFETFRLEAEHLREGDGLEAAPLAREGHEPVVAGRPAPETRESAGQPAAPQEIVAPPSLPGTVPSEPLRDLPAFCRVAATLTPSSDSDIRIEVWLPESGWNGKFQAVGNGGCGGTISYGRLADALRRGYATASTDTGHVGTFADASFAFNRPEKVLDFGYRAVLEMTVRAKALIENRHGSGPKLSYWNGCSTGGRQGLKEAQRYPADFDGILAGAPGTNMTSYRPNSSYRP